jgi:predicted mannosyl-3-phosphoglycerate phosphatase (HAD superfamily)
MSEETLKQIAVTVKEHLRWARLSGLVHLRTIFEKEFKGNEEKVVYELSDGEKSIRDLEKLTGISRSKVSLLWRRWYNMGIMERSEKYEGKRMRKSFSLLDVGLDVELPSSIGLQKKSEDEFE